MPTIGAPELVLIGMILVLVFGASRLPKLGESAGRAVRKLLQATRSDERIGVRSSDREANEHGHDDDVTDAELIDRDGSRDDTRGS